MYPARSRKALTALAVVLLAALPARAQEAPPKSFVEAVEQVNKKVVKLYGAGGFQGLASYGTGVLVSPQGHILTVNSPMLDTTNLRVHLSDGRRFQAKVIVAEPELDVALVKIDKVEDLPYFDVARAAKAKPAQPGDWVLAFSNQFHIATRDEPVSVQHGVVAAYSKLHGRRGVFKAPYTGEVYIVDAITNNSGAAGGAVTTRKGELLGLIGKELRNDLTDTWINYAMPIQALADFVGKAMKGAYKPIVREKKEGQQGYHGIVLVPNVVERTPPFIEELVPGSPAVKAKLRPDDLIVYIDGQQVASVQAFHEMLKDLPPGTVVKLEVRRGDKLVPIELTLGQPAAVKKP